MNQSYSELEAELAALRPLDPSPELRQRIATHRAHSVAARSRWRWGLALAGGVAASWGAAFLLQGGDRRRVELDQTIVQVKPVQAPKPTTHDPRERPTSAPWRDRLKTLMPCSTKLPWPLREPTRGSFESVRSIVPKRNQVPFRRELMRHLKTVVVCLILTVFPFLAARRRLRRPEATRRQRGDEVLAGLRPAADP